MGTVRKIVPAPRDDLGIVRLQQAAHVPAPLFLSDGASAVVGLAVIALLELLPSRDRLLVVLENGAFETATSLLCSLSQGEP